MNSWTLLRPLGRFVMLGLGVFTVARFLLVALRQSPVGDVTEWPHLFLVGLRFDLITLAYLLIPVWLGLAFAPARWSRWTQRLLRIFLTACVAAIAILECATWPSLKEFGNRPAALFLEFLGHPREVIGMLAGGFTGEIVAGFIVMLAAGGLAWRTLRPLPPGSWPQWRTRLLLFPLGAAALFVTARSSFGHRPANLSTAVFSENHFHNQAALNSTYTLLYAAYRRKHEANSDRAYGRMEPARIIEIVRRESQIPLESFNSSRPTWHVEKPSRPRNTRPPNVVVILLESFGAEYTGRLGGTALTPEFDRLATQGLAFDQLFSTGTRTARGIEAVISGVFPSAARSVLKLGLAQQGFFTAPALLREAGYSTHFIYGGAANFDEMEAFFEGNGVEHIWDQSTLQRPNHAVGVWGIHDEDLFAEADRILAQQGDQPFFALILSTSNHTPFDYPRDRVPLDPAYPAASAENAIKYTDHALGSFFARARRSAYWANTLFLVVADHGTRVSGDQLIPLYKFHIPAVILGPESLLTPGVVRRLCSQVDLMPTLLALTGREWCHPMMGQNLLALPEDERTDSTHGRALLQYETTYGYWKDDDLLVLRPDLPPAQFQVDRSHGFGREELRLSGTATHPKFVETAVAHVLLPTWLYRERLY